MSDNNCVDVVDETNAIDRVVASEDSSCNSAELDGASDLETKLGNVAVGSGS